MYSRAVSMLLMAADSVISKLSKCALPDSRNRLSRRGQVSAIHQGLTGQVDGVFAVFFELAFEQRFNHPAVNFRHQTETFRSRQKISGRYGLVIFVESAQQNFNMTVFCAVLQGDDALSVETEAAASAAAISRPSALHAGIVEARGRTLHRQEFCDCPATWPAGRRRQRARSVRGRVAGFGQGQSDGCAECHGLPAPFKRGVVQSERPVDQPGYVQTQGQLRRGARSQIHRRQPVIIAPYFSQTSDKVARSGPPAGRHLLCGRTDR